MPTALYGSGLDQLAQADINDRDQVLRDRSGFRDYLAQMAAERNAHNATERQYGLGMYGEDTRRQDSRHRLKAALDDIAARKAVADFTTGRSLEGLRDSNLTQKDIADFSTARMLEGQKNSDQVRKEVEDARTARILQAQLAATQANKEIADIESGRRLTGITDTNKSILAGTVDTNLSNLTGRKYVSDAEKEMNDRRARANEFQSQTLFDSSKWVSDNDLKWRQGATQAEKEIADIQERNRKAISDSLRKGEADRLAWEQAMYFNPQAKPLSEEAKIHLTELNTKERANQRLRERFAHEANLEASPGFVENIGREWFGIGEPPTPGYAEKWPQRLTRNWDEDWRRARAEKVLNDMRARGVDVDGLGLYVNPNNGMVEYPPQNYTYRSALMGRDPWGGGPSTRGRWPGGAPAGVTTGSSSNAASNLGAFGEWMTAPSEVPGLGYDVPEASPAFRVIPVARTNPTTNKTYNRETRRWE